MHRWHCTAMALAATTVLWGLLAASLAVPLQPVSAGFTPTPTPTYTPTATATPTPPPPPPPPPTSTPTPAILMPESGGAVSKPWSPGLFGALGAAALLAGWAMRRQRGR